MIYTVTLNPSIDYIAQVDGFETGIINRTTQERCYPGGKGINVSIVLAGLGIETTALGFIAGFTGRQIEQQLESLGIHTDFVRVSSGMSRINVKLRSEVETEINGTGPEIGAQELKELFDKLEGLRTGDTLVLAGSIPACLADTIYEEICRRLETRGVRLVIDAAGKLLLHTLPYHPFLIKPNQHELGELFEVTITKRSEILPYAARLQQLGARNVLVSLAGEGAALLDEQGNFYEEAAARGRVVNSVGAGDSMVAGFLAACQRVPAHKNCMRTALRTGLCAGSASAFSDALATRAEIESLYASLYSGQAEQKSQTE